MKNCPVCNDLFKFKLWGNNISKISKGRYCCEKCSLFYYPEIDSLRAKRLNIFMDYAYCNNSLAFYSVFDKELKLINTLHVHETFFFNF